jgi:hypothetical protein
MPTLKRASLVRQLFSTLACPVVGTFLAISGYAAPTVTVLAPKAGVSVGSPIFYSAYATSAACTKGIAAMRIYTADHVGAYTVNGAHIETFIKLNPGTYNTVVQAWDKLWRRRQDHGKPDCHLDRRSDCLLAQRALALCPAAHRGFRSELGMCRRHQRDTNLHRRSRQPLHR